MMLRKVFRKLVVAASCIPIMATTEGKAAPTSLTITHLNEHPLMGGAGCRWYLLSEFKLAFAAHGTAAVVAEEDTQRIQIGVDAADVLLPYSDGGVYVASGITFKFIQGGKYLPPGSARNRESEVSYTNFTLQVSNGRATKLVPLVGECGA